MVKEKKKTEVYIFTKVVLKYYPREIQRLHRPQEYEVVSTVAIPVAQLREGQSQCWEPHLKKTARCRTLIQKPPKMAPEFFTFRDWYFCSYEMSFHG